MTAAGSTRSRLEDRGDAEPNRYGAIAALSALVGSGRRRRHLRCRPALPRIPITSTHGAQGRARPRSHVRTSGPAASTGPTSPGALTGDIAAGALALGVPSPAPHVSSRDAPAGRVTLGGAATTAGSSRIRATRADREVRAAAAAGRAGCRPGPEATDPLAPVTSTVGSGANSVGSAVVERHERTRERSAGSGTGRHRGERRHGSAVSAVDQAVSATTLVTTENCCRVARRLHTSRCRHRAGQAATRGATRTMHRQPRWTAREIDATARAAEDCNSKRTQQFTPIPNRFQGFTCSRRPPTYIVEREGASAPRRRNSERASPAGQTTLEDHEGAGARPG